MLMVLRTEPFCVCEGFEYLIFLEDSSNKYFDMYLCFGVRVLTE